MTRPRPGAQDQRLHQLATQPATRTQVGAVVGEFERLGVHDRDERLMISAALLGLDELTSTGELVMGQAGKLVGILRSVPDLPELRRLTTASRHHEAEHPDHGPTPLTALLGPVVRALASMIKSIPSGNDAELPRPAAIHGAICPSNLRHGAAGGSPCPCRRRRRGARPARRPR